MTLESDNVEAVLASIEARQRKRFVRANLFVGFYLLIAAFLTYWTTSQAIDLAKKREELASLHDAISEQKTQANDIRLQLQHTREASEHIRLGIDSFHAKNYKAAVRAYNRAIGLDSLNPLTFDLRGYSLLKDGSPQEAVKSLERSVSIDSQYVWGHYDLALAYWTAGKRVEGLAEVKKVLDLRPDFKDVIKSDGQFAKFNQSPQFRVLLGNQR